MGIATLIAMLSVVMSGCAVPGQPGPQDYTGTWRLQGEDGRAAEFVLSADRTFTARNIPIDLACRTGDVAASPPGCADDEYSTSFTGHWKTAEGSSPGIRLYHAGKFVRQGYPSSGGLGFFVQTLDVPRPDYLFVRADRK
ncbi:hypothetical protein [Curtobacterium sp. MCPF17_046]|uniref:hypothetical protein n=1 Tax=Curtobacterium sp. MCPF17_046 TaxID=2175663 RepID=UPI000D8617C5|nr:hypothetical protein [Curtobacterium sp. MCPF17_046]PYY39060.1 hypothetical protein DEJ32_08925 [Curtobacterium sp. MCPF17_046]